MGGIRARLRRSAPLFWLLAVALLTLEACGTHGSVPALGAPAQATLTAAGAAQSVGAVTLTPFNAMHIAVYLRGRAIPALDAPTPAELRANSCDGRFVAPLTDGLPASTLALQTGAPIATQPNSAGGENIALATSGAWVVAVYAHRDDPNAALVACGQPLSERRQYFDLYPPSVGNAGVAIGTALMEPLLATRLRVTLTQPSASPIAWSVTNGGCSGPQVTGGAFAANAPGDAVIFAPLDAQHWSIAVTLAGGHVICGKVTR